MSKLFFVLTLFVFTTQPTAFAFDHERDSEEEIDVGSVGLKAGYVATGAGSALALAKINGKLRGAWQDALPKETKEFADAERNLRVTAGNNSNANDAYYSTKNEYEKARDGYSYKTARIETQYQWVNVPVVNEKGVTTGHTMQYQPVQVTVYDTHYVPPKPGRAAELKPEVKRLKELLEKTDVAEQSAQKIFDEKKEILEKAERDLLEGRLANVDVKLVDRIKSLQNKRTATISLLSLAAVVGAADIGSHLFSDGSLIDVGRSMIKKKEDSAYDRAPAHDALNSASTVGSNVQ